MTGLRFELLAGDELIRIGKSLGTGIDIFLLCSCQFLSPVATSMFLQMLQSGVVHDGVEDGERYRNVIVLRRRENIAEV